MNMKKSVIALGAAMLLGLTGCGGQTQVNVEQAGMLTTAATGSDKFAGVVVSENVVEIERDTEKQIDELYVAAGDEVRINEKLFEYDTDKLSLDVDKQELEMDKLEQQIKDLKSQVTALEKEIKELEKKKQSTDIKELELRTVNADLTQATFDKSALQAEITYNKNMLKNAVVRSPIKGTVRSINENGSPYITIQQSGAFQIKGMLNELSLNAGIMEGVGVTVLSRTDETAFWTGTVSMVDYNNAGSNEYDELYGGGDASGMTTSTSYPFYITLDDTDGLLLGQHVYIQISAAGISDDLLRIPESYIMDVLLDEETYLTTGTVWGVNMDTLKLEKYPVTLGEYDPTYGTYVVLDGITAETYLADPAAEGVRAGAAVTLRDELEYKGQTLPPETTAPAGETGAPAGGSDAPAEEPGASAEAPGETVKPVFEYQPPVGGDASEPTDDPLNYGGSLVMPTDDPDKR